VAEATRTVLESLATDDRFALEEDGLGVYHVAARGGASRFELAKAILDLDPDRAEHVVESVERISAARYGSPTRRPASSILDSGRIESRFGVRIPPWRTDLRAALRGQGAK
jgi:dTDP-4-dehydrorhamnose reductase